MGMMEFMVDMALEREIMELIVTNTCFKRQKNEVATYVSGDTVSAIDYLLLRGCDRRHIKNVKVIAGEECVSQHWLLVGDVVISSARRKKKRMHIPRLKVWKLREPNVKQEFARLVTERKDEVFEADSVEIIIIIIIIIIQRQIVRRRNMA